MSFDFEFTPQTLQRAISTNKEVQDWYKEMIVILPKYNINTRLRVAAFISQCAHESLDFRILEENLNYSESALRRVFSKYFPNGLEKSYARKPERIANRVYGGRMGNGPESSGDGWRYRGRGIIQLTGFNNYQAFGNSINLTPTEVIEYVQTKRGALESACWYWNSRNINSPADRGDIERVTRLINGGTHGLKDRIHRYNIALGAFKNNATNNKPSVNETNHNLETVKRGSRGNTVKKIQEYLNISNDGIFGPNTENSLKRWQQFNGLTPNGIADEKTLRKMFPQEFS